MQPNAHQKWHAEFLPNTGYFLQKIEILNEGEMAEISLQGDGGYRLPAHQNGIFFGMLAAHVFWNRFVAFVGRREAVFVPNDRVLSERKMATMPIVATISELKISGFNRGKALDSMVNPAEILDVGC